jgi:hypothetical protein
MLEDDDRRFLLEAPRSWLERLRSLLVATAFVVGVRREEEVRRRRTDSGLLIIFECSAWFPLSMPLLIFVFFRWAKLLLVKVLFYGNGLQY